MKNVIVAVAIVLGGCLGLGVTVNPAYVKSLIIGGGHLDADGGITLGNDGTATFSGAVEFLDDMNLSGDLEVGPTAPDEAYTALTPLGLSFYPATAWTRNAPIVLNQADTSLALSVNDAASQALTVSNSGAGIFSLTVEGPITSGTLVHTFDLITVSGDTISPGTTYGCLRLTATNPRTVTTITAGTAGTQLILVGTDNTDVITIATGGNVLLNGGTSAALGSWDALTVMCTTDNRWIELARSDN